MFTVLKRVRFFYRRLFPFRLAVFASGAGSLFETIYKHTETFGLTKLWVVISNNKKSPVHEKARLRGIPTYWIPTKDGRDADRQLEVLKKHRVDLCILGGYLRPISARVIEHYPGRFINIHPALLPRHGGKGMYGHFVHESVVRSGDPESGATVHFLTSEYDVGPILLQTKLNLPPGKDALWLEKEVRTLEHELLPKAIEKLVFHLMGLSKYCSLEKE